MAFAYIREYQSVAQLHGLLQIASEPALLDQTPVAIGGGSLASAPFNPSTRFIRIHVDAICSFVIGAPTPTATSGNARMAANQTEYFGVVTGQMAAFITNV